MQIDVGGFKRALGRYATGVVVVSAHSAGHDHAMTANSFTAVSLDPPLVLFCVEQDARFHDAVQDAGVFGVSVLAAEHRSIATWLSTPGRPLIGQLTTVPHTRGPNDCVLISGALAHLECEIRDVHAAGDHSIVVGEVIHLTASDDPPPALLYYRSRYASTPGAY
ncbi:MAG TPA: flavin reductase [Intrasporangiaceae bacterium]|nr:flavin reductase [Intrasporangiaceae bacterium]